MSFAHPIAFSLLILLLLPAVPRRQPRHYVAFNVCGTAPLPRPPWYRNLPAILLTLFLILLIALLAEPTGGVDEIYTVQEARKILLLIDTSSSMEGKPIQVAKSVAESFIRQRPASDSIGVVLFSDVASGGILTRNHRGLIKELHLQKGIGISGTQLGVGLFKCLASFIEDEVETVLWQNRALPEGQRQQRFQHALDEINRLGRHLLQKDSGEFVLRLPEIPDQRRLGKGKVIIVLSDARVRLKHAAAEVIDHLQVLHLLENLGFERFYFISVDTLPGHLEPFFQRHPAWRFFHIQRLTERRQLARAYAEIDRLERIPSRLQVRTTTRALYPYALPALLLVPVALTLRLCVPFRSLP